MSEKKHHYLYRITNQITGKIYVGVHSTSNLDDGYVGSGVQLLRAYDKYGVVNFKKEILEFFNTRDELLQEEKKIVNEDFCKREDTYNIAIGGYGGWFSKGKVPVKNKDGEIYYINKENERYRNGELVHIFKNKVVVKDSKGNTYHVDVDNEEYINGNFVHINKGYVHIKDNEGNYFRIKKDDPIYLNGGFVGRTKDYIVVKDKDGNIFNIHKDDPRWVNKEVVSINKNKISVKDKNGNMFKVNKGDPRLETGELTGVNGGRTYITNGVSNKLIEKNDEIPEGWRKGKVWISENGGDWTEEKKKAVSERVKNLKFINNGEKNKRVPIDKLQEYLDNGWKEGRLPFKWSKNR